MSYKVFFTPEAEEQLIALYRHIAEAASPDRAIQFSEAILSYCDGLTVFPHRGTMRDDVRPGLRVIPYKRRVLIAFYVNGDLVSIVGIFYGGQDYEAILGDRFDEV